jgi:hypothetical protein
MVEKYLKIKTNYTISALRLKLPNVPLCYQTSKVPVAETDLKRELVSIRIKKLDQLSNRVMLGSNIWHLATDYQVLYLFISGPNNRVLQT